MIRRVFAALNAVALPLVLAAAGPTLVTEPITRQRRRLRPTFRSPARRSVSLEPVFGASATTPVASLHFTRHVRSSNPTRRSTRGHHGRRRRAGE